MHMCSHNEIASFRKSMEDHVLSLLKIKSHYACLNIYSPKQDNLNDLNTYLIRQLRQQHHVVDAHMLHVDVRLPVEGLQ